MSATTSPERNVTIRAAAGTGKTWLLTSRLIALLLRGVPPGSILAITFTRKAAAEIYRRINERLLAMTSASDHALRRELDTLGIAVTRKTMTQARAMFERLLTSEQELRATTFHAFCQEILRRFPLEAEVPPGFALLESTTTLERAAWRALEHEATAQPRGVLAEAIDVLLQSCGGIANTRQALNEFIKHRSDWWSYTEDKPDPVAYSQNRLRSTLRVEPKQAAAPVISNDADVVKDLLRYAALLRQHPTATNAARAAQLERACRPTTPAAEAFDLVSQVFLTADAAPRALERSERLHINLGAVAIDELFALHAKLTTCVQALYEQQLQSNTLKTTCAWYRCGQRLLHHYQRLKAEQGLLDFTDLEWQTYRLLNRSQHAEWIQYKLDQRIDHLLVDEFQDTNPTQWRLLLPLLREMAAGDTQRKRSVFIVGDEKQSIYRFRRADPGLFNTAQNWLTRYMAATTSTQDKSWRASPAIMQFVNLIYEATPRHTGEISNTLGDAAEDFTLENFRTHDTYHEGRWGRVELLPLIRQRPTGIDAPSDDYLRNPLLQPRKVNEDQRYRAEGRLVADKIAQLIDKPIDDGCVRPLEFGDMMLLLRDRTHALAYEAALRDAGIPYVGAGRGTFVECLEIQDLIHLLQCFIAPYNDLALACVLRCPIFNCREQDLSLLARGKPSPPWRRRLTETAAALTKDHSLTRAHKLLERWAAVADKIPVHDLLDKIYAEGNVVTRYVSAAPPHLRNRVQTNLRHLLELALEMDSGRYPSLARFLERLPIVADEERHALAEASSIERGYVRIMTIHAAKGLEKPVVFLVDTMRDYRARVTGVRALVDWPVEAPQPRHLQLIGKKADQDQVTKRLLKEQDEAIKREEANLLYVALTRAKHALFISGCEPGRGQGRGWYAFIEKRIRNAVVHRKLQVPALQIQQDGDTPGGGVVLESGTVPVTDESPAGAQTVDDKQIDPALARVLPPDHPPAMIYPSRVTASDDRRGAFASEALTADIRKTRGILIHRMLELLTSGLDRLTAERRIANEMADMVPKPLFAGCWREACAVVDDPALKPFFDPCQYKEARSEVPVLYRQARADVYGIIDRLLIREREVVIIDYKTHVAATCANVEQLAFDFVDQMRLYAAGVRMLWPLESIRALLLFTAPRAIVDLTTRIEA